MEEDILLIIGLNKLLQRIHWWDSDEMLHLAKSAKIS